MFFVYFFTPVGTGTIRIQQDSVLLNEAVAHHLCSWAVWLLSNETVQIL